MGQWKLFLVPFIGKSFCREMCPSSGHFDRWHISCVCAQVWVSCSSVRLVEPPAGRSLEDDDVDDEDDEDYSLYTEEDYAELEHVFEY